VSRPVIVLGMHRSGTSALTRVVNLLGLAMCSVDDLYQGQHNAAGYWESSTLLRTNNRIFETMGGETNYPPALREGWHLKPRAQQLLNAMRRDFWSVYSHECWVWKDPRTCITLPLWRLALAEAHPIALYVSRDPAEIARSLYKREGLSPSHSAAMWERYTRSALIGARGMPFLHVRYQELLERGPAAVADIKDNLIQLGAGVNGSPTAAAAHLRNPSSQPEDIELTRAQKQLLLCIDELPVCTHRFSIEGLPAESPGNPLVFQRARIKRRWRRLRRRVSMAR